MNANQTHTPPIRRLIVTFIPQEWISDMSIPCSAPEQVDATDHLLSLSLSQIHGVRDGSDLSDGFVDPLARAHYGPYEVRCVNAILEYFGIERLTDITEEMLEAARRGECLEKDGAHQLQAWLVIFGEDRMSFFCHAVDIEHAIEQCHDAYPGAEVITAMMIPSAEENLGPDERQALLDDIAKALGMPVVEVEDKT